MQKIDILITGVGGQGIILASDVLAKTGMLAGYDVKKTDSMGMAQRGGSVISHVRFGTDVHSPLITPGDADFLLGMEMLEAARFAFFLKPGGTAVINDYKNPPLSVVGGTEKYPASEQILSIIRERARNLILTDGLEKARSLGNEKTVNIYLLGLLSRMLPLPEKTWHESLTGNLPEKIIKINLKVFEAGKKDFEGAAVG